MNKKFIRESSRTQKYTTVSIVVSAVVFLGVVLFFANGYLSTNSTSFQAFVDFIKLQMTEVSPIGLFIMAFFGSFFFIPAPIDPMFILSLTKGNDPTLAFLLVVISSTVGNIINYYIGVKLSKYAMYFVSLKKMYEAKRWVNKFGSLAIVLFNLTPLPGSILTFALGIAKYNFLRMIVYFTIGISLKFGAITAYFVYF